MNYINKLLMLIIVILITSCTSAIRYSSNNGRMYADNQNTNNKNYSATNKNLNKEINDEIDLNEDNRFDKYQDIRKEIIKEAEKYIGTPYCYGGNSLDCFDCSGFVIQVFDKFGIVLPRTASEQYSNSSIGNYSKPQMGDLVFFKKGNMINHVGIYIANNKFIHASTSSGVMISSLSEEYFNNCYAGFRSVLN